MFLPIAGGLAIYLGEAIIGVTGILAGYTILCFSGKAIWVWWQDRKNRIDWE